MPVARHARAYRGTESKYKGGAREMYVTYDLEQATRGGGTATYPKVKRVYIAGEVTHWQVGDFTKKSGRAAHGVQIEYEQSRRGYRRGGFEATRGDMTYPVQPTSVVSAAQRFTQVVEIPERARNVQFHRERLPAEYRGALQAVR